MEIKGLVEAIVLDRGDGARMADAGWNRVSRWMHVNLATWGIGAVACAERMNILGL